MNLRKSFSFMFIFCLLLSTALGQDKPSPFSSLEEKHFILTLAGRDGQIDHKEWDKNRSDREYFDSLAWEDLIEFDFDGDGFISVNEFFKYLDWDASLKEVLDREKPDLDKSIAARLASSKRGKGTHEEPPVFDRRMLHRRAQIAKRTKYQKPSDPQENLQLYKNRMNQLSTITARRRIAATRHSNKTEVKPTQLRELYKSRLVKYRLSKTPSDLSPRRAALDEQRRHTPSNEEMSRRRKDLLLKKQTRTESLPVNQKKEPSPPPPLRPSHIRRLEDMIKSKKPSNIRGLLPSPRSKNGKDSPSPEKRREKNVPDR